MTHTYYITGMTCTGCQFKVSGLLSKVPGVTNVAIDLEKGDAAINMATHVPTSALQTALADYPKYQLTEADEKPQPTTDVVMTDEVTSQPFYITYKPVILIF